MAKNTKVKKFNFGGDVVDEISYDGSPSFGTEASLRRGRPLNFRELRGGLEPQIQMDRRPEPQIQMARPEFIEPARPVEPPTPVINTPVIKVPPRPVPRSVAKKGGLIKNNQVKKRESASRGDGIAQRGRTKGTMVKMAGKC
jgi:hypothetical protein